MSSNRRRAPSSRKSSPGSKNARSPQAKAPLWKSVLNMFSGDEKVSLPKRSSPSRRRLGMETLEDRVVLTTNIDFTGFVLTITFDGVPASETLDLNTTLSGGNSFLNVTSDSGITLSGGAAGLGFTAQGAGGTSSGNIDTFFGADVINILGAGNSQTVRFNGSTGGSQFSGTTVDSAVENVVFQTAGSIFDNNTGVGNANLDADANTSIVVNASITTLVGGFVDLLNTNAVGDIDVNAAISSTGGNGNVTLSAGGNVDIAAPISTVGAGAISITGDNNTGGAGLVTSTAAGTITTAGGNITIASLNDSVILDGAVNAGTGDVSIDASNNAGDSISGSGLITADDLSLTADSGIGASGSPINTSVNNVEASTDTGGIFINEAGTVTIGGVSGALSGLDVVTSGDIDFTAGNSITIDEEVANAGGGNISILTPVGIIDVNAPVTATGGDGDIDISAEGDIPVSAAITAVGAGNITILADNNFGTIGEFNLAAGGSVTTVDGNIDIQSGADDIVVAGGGVVDISTSGTGSIQLTAQDISFGSGGTSGNVDALGTGNVQVDATGNVTVDFGTFVGTQNTGSVTVNAAGDVTVTGAGSSIFSSNPGAGPVVITVGGTFTTVAGAIGVVTDGSDVTISATDMVIGAPIDTFFNATNGPAIVTLQQFDTTALQINLGGGGANLGISDAELALVTASVLRIGRTDNAGDILIDANVTVHAGYSQLELFSGGAIDTDTFISVAVARLGLTASTGIGQLSDFDMDVDNVEATTDTGGMSFDAVGDVEIGGVNGTLGGLQELTSGDILFFAGGTITLSDTDGPEATVQGGSASGNVSMFAGTDVTSTNFFDLFDVPAGDLLVNAGQDILLGTPGGDNDADVDGTATFTAGRDVILDGDADIRSDGFGNNTGGSVVVTAGRNITLANTSGTDASIQALGTAGADITLTAGANAFFTNLATTGGGVSSTSGDVTINADRINNAAASGGINAGAGDVNILPVSAAWTIDLGSTTDAAANTLELSDAELDNITVGGILRIGDTGNTGNIELSDPIDPANATVLSLQTAGGLDDNTAGGGPDITIANLAIRTGTGIGLGGDDIDIAVSTLAFSNAAGAVIISNTGGLTIDALDGLNTSANNGTTTTITAASPLTFAVDTFSAGNATYTAGETADDPICADNLTINPGVTVSSGAALTLRAGDDINVPVGATAQAAGALTLFAGFNNLDLCGDLNLGGTLIGNPINLIALGDIVLGFIDAGAGALTITSLTGAILDGNDPAIGTLNIRAGTVALSAVTGIGRPDAGLGIDATEAPLELDVDGVAAFTDNGGISLTNNLGLAAGTLSVLNLPNFFGPVDGVQDAGNVVLVNNGSINITAAPVTTDSGANPALGNITITANGAASDILTGGNQTAVTNNAGGANSVFGIITLTAGRDVLLGDVGGTGFGDVVSANDIVVNAGRNITIDEDTFVTSNDNDGTAGNIVMTASSPAVATAVPGGNISLTQVGTPGSHINALGTGSITLQTGQFVGAGTGTFTATAGGTGVTTNGGDININADDVVIADPINAGGIAGGVVRIRQAGTTLRNVKIGAGASDLGISDAELGFITGSLLRIGRLDNPGNMVIDGDVTIHPGYSTMTLLEGGDGLSQLPGAGLRVQNLAILSNSTVTLKDSENEVAVLAGRVTDATEAFTYRDFNALEVGSVNDVPVPLGGVVPLNGIITNNGDITVQAGQTLLLSQVVTAGAGIVRFVAGDTISQTAAGIITGASLGATTSNNDILLGTAANDVNIFAASTIGGDVVFNDVDDLIIGSVTADGSVPPPPLFTGAAGIVVVGSGDITVRTGTTLAVNQVVTAGGGDVRFSSGGTISQGAAGVITADELGARTTAGDISLGTVASDVNTMAASAPGSFLFADTDGVTVGQVLTNGALFATTTGITVGAAGTARIQAGGTVDQTALGAITGGALGVNVTGGAASDIALGTAANDVDTFAATTTGGDVTFVDTDGLVIGTVSALNLFLGASGIATVGGDVTIQTGGFLTVNNPVNAGAGDVRFSAGGAITQAAAGVITADEFGARTTAGVIALGTATNDVNTFAAATAGGKVTFKDADDLIIGAVSANAPFFAATTGIFTNSGDVTIQTGTTLTVNAAVNAAAGGTVRFSAGGNVTQGAAGAITGLALGVRTTAGNIDLDDAVNDVGTFAAASAGGSISYTDLNDLIVGTVSADLPFFATTVGILSFGGAITVSTGEVGFLLSVNQPIISGGGNIILNADDMAINAAVNAGAGIVTLRQAGTTTRNIDLGSNTAGTLGLTDGEIDQVTASVIRIGRIDNAGNITITNTISPAGTTVLHLITGGGVIDGTGGEQADIIVANLAMEATTGVGSTNDIDVQVTNLASSNTTTGNIIVTNTGALVLLPVDGLVSATTAVRNLAANGKVDITASSPLTVAANVSSAGDVILTAGNSAAAGDNLTVNPGVTVQSTAGNTTLRAGDTVIVPVGATVTAFNTLTLEGGLNELDADGGVNLLGAVNGSVVNVVGGGGAETFNLNPTAAPALISADGKAGNDTFNVTPKAATAFFIQGGDPQFPTLPGDTLNIDFTGATGIVFTPGPPNTGSGTFTFTNRQQINFVSIETLNFFDFGDAPDTGAGTGPGNYNTTLADDGPRHRLGGALFLGAAIDFDADGQPNGTATGDDTDFDGDDEDGVVFTVPLIANLSGNVTVTASTNGLLDAWIDFNNDGDFLDAGEQIAASLPVGAGANNVGFLVPGTALAGTHVSRFRVSTAGGLAPTGPADDGEVEDHITPAVNVVPPGTVAVIAGKLVVSGTDLRDVIKIFPVNVGGVPNIRVTIKTTGLPLAQFTFPAAGITSIGAFGLGGNDSITVSQQLTLPTQLFGNDGNDKIYGGGGADIARGGAGNDFIRTYGGNDILLGEGGNDDLEGGAGRDISIGGTGKDKVYSRISQDILIGGTTVYDANDAALLAIMAQWSSNLSFEQRVDDLHTSLLPLTAATVIDDGIKDVLWSGVAVLSRDWFLDFLRNDSINFKIAGDRLN